jgi:hypothetical protein
LTDIENKIRSLASQNAGLQGLLLAGGLFRMFNRQLQQGYINQGACVRYLLVSNPEAYNQQGRQNISQALVQFDCMDRDPVRCRQLRDAMITWLDGVDLAATNQFDSPPTTPRQFPTFITNERSGMEPQTQPPVFVETIDVRFWNLET